MSILMVLLILFTLISLGLALSLFKLSRTLDLQKIVRFLSYFIHIVFALLGVAYLISLGISFYSLAKQDVALIMVVELLIRIYFFYIIYISAKTLLDQLKQNIIFDVKNSDAVLKIGQSFILMAAIEIISGFILGLIYFIEVSGDFSLNINEQPIIFIVIGFILYIVSLIYRQAIAIHEENQLTI